MRKVRLKKQTKLFDSQFFFITLILTFIGLVAVADASAPIALKTFSDRFYFVKQQALWGAIGIVLLLVFSKVHYSFWGKIAVYFMAASLVLLVLVLLPGIAPNISGAKRWILFGSISFQPSEIAKLALVCYMAKVATKEKSTIAYFAPLVIVVGLVMAEPDMGTALVIVAMGFAQMFISGINIFHLISAAVFTSIASLLFIITSGYRKARLLTFLEQTKDPLGKGYHIRQILYALGSGGLIGVGLGQSRQKFLFLPEAATDSIFAVIAEEVGFIGAAVIIILFIGYIYRALRIMNNSPDEFSRVLAVGIIAWLGGQIFLNIGSVVALVPLTGIPLPFISYGGSSLTTALMATGILLNISKHESKPKKRKN